MKLPSIDGFLLAGVWIGVMLALANDVFSSPFRPIILGAMCAFVFIAAVGMAWRRYWKARSNKEIDAYEMRRHVNDRNAQ